MNKKRLNKILVLVVVIIWAVIIVQIISALIRNKDDQVKIDEGRDVSVKLPDLAARDTSNDDEIILQRNPFELRPKVVRYIAAPVPPKIAADKRPAGIMFRVGGVIINESRRVVLLEDITNKRVVFLREGEKYLNLQIIAVQHESVIISENGSKGEYLIEKKTSK